MTVCGFDRGWPIVFIGEWRYADTGKPTFRSRRCSRCKRLPTPEGYDACLGHILGAVSACCGHGVERGYVKLGKADA